MDDLILPVEQQAGNSDQKAEFLIGKVVYWNASSGAQIQLDGEDEPMDKYFKVIRSRPLVVGSRYLIMKHSGTYVVIGEIGLPVTQ